jgi:tryptophan-rich sensory protein
MTPSHYEHAGDGRAATSRGRGVSLLVFALLVGLIATFGTRFGPSPWSEALQQPAWAPPNAVFGPVWTVLYIMIATAGWLTWVTTRRSTPALWIWGAQLALNGLWSWLYFGLHRIDLALLDICALLALILAFIGLAWRERRLASWLFLPYAAWVGFATALNFAIWRLN